MMRREKGKRDLEIRTWIHIAQLDIVDLMTNVHLY